MFYRIAHCWHTFCTEAPSSLELLNRCEKPSTIHCPFTCCRPCQQSRHIFVYYKMYTHCINPSNTTTHVAFIANGTVTHNIIHHNWHHLSAIWHMKTMKGKTSWYSNAIDLCTPWNHRRTIKGTTGNPRNSHTGHGVVIVLVVLCDVCSGLC